MQQPRLSKIAPKTCAMMYWATCDQGKRPLTASPGVKAGLMWLPETLPKHQGRDHNPHTVTNSDNEPATLVTFRTFKFNVATAPIPKDNQDGCSQRPVTY